MTPGPDVVWHPSPNFGPRRDGLTPSLIVLHYTEMAQCPDALDRLCDPETEVSAHYLISEQGDVWQLVKEDQRAWHAGAGAWAGAADVNSRSIGIELSNTGKMPFSEPQMQALEALMRGIMARWNIAPEGVIGHSDMTPTRKVDPGTRFDWRRIARQGLSVWPEPGDDAAPFLQSALAFGYPTDEAEADILHAFRQRFRPALADPNATPDTIDRAMAADLAHRFGVDRGGSTP